MIRGIVEAVEGVSKVGTDFKRHAVTVTYDEEMTDVAKIREALDEGGFPSDNEYKWVTP